MNPPRPPGMDFAADPLHLVQDLVQASADGSPVKAFHGAGWHGEHGLYRINVRLEILAPGETTLQLTGACIPGAAYRIPVRQRTRDARTGPVTLYCADRLPSQLEIASSGTEWINSYALVTYIPDPLGGFLDDLRRNLAPECNPHAHVTLMPPRPLSGPPDEAWKQIHEYTKSLPAFPLQATGIGVFPETHVIYIELGMGREQLLELHAALNRGPLHFAEPFEYHPHITLAQELPLEAVAGAARLARDMWRQCPHSRIFPVEELTFVRSTAEKCWKDLASVQLERISVVR